MEEKLISIIGPSEGASMAFEEWVVQARAAGLRPENIQRLKRQGLVHTVIDENGVVVIVRGQRPQ